jgi:2-polyprenyl-3-methyl-5-hydroxy-6-metoxy-1,4-benzoquinol methylase
MSRFDKLAKEWDLNPRRVNSALKTTRKLKEIIDIRGMDILDFGSGTGLISFDLFEEADSITAMDNSLGMLEELDIKVKEAGILNIKTKLFDANISKLPKNSYDLIVTAMTLHHIKDPKAFIDDAKESLKMGGYLVISDLESEDGTFHTRGNEGVEHFGFDKQQIKEWYEDAGFELLYLNRNETIKKDQDFHIFLAIGKNG